MKRQLSFLFLMGLNFIFFNALMATPAGNLKIVASGSSSTEPTGGWFEGLGKKGTTYTLSASAISVLMDSNASDLTLDFDTIYISGNVVIDRSAKKGNQFLSLRTNSYAKGAIVFMPGSSLTLKTASTQKSYVTLASGNILGSPDLNATEVRLSNVTKAYQRIEMNGFKNWRQGQVDTLLASASKVGDDIGNGAYDFTKNTKFTVSNGVFSMTAQTDFLNGKKMGFKNLDRDGKLSGTDTTLNPYPDNFFVDLSKAEGIRFKVEVKNGTAQSFNIGLSNCLKVGQWHVKCFEYYMYDIPFTAVDPDGYVTLPFTLLQKLSWGGDWEPDKLLVFIMEVKNVSKNTTVSFSDVHGYTTATQPNADLTIGNIKASNILSFNINKGVLKQLPNTHIEALQTSFNVERGMILSSPENMPGTSIQLNTPYAYLQLRSAKAASTTVNFSNSSLARYSLANVWADNKSVGAKYVYAMTTKDTLPHTYEVAYKCDYANLNTVHDVEVCGLEGSRLTASGAAKSNQYHWFTEEKEVYIGDTLNIPAFAATGSYRYFVSFDTLVSGNRYFQTRSAQVNVYPSYEIYDTLVICSSALPYQWKDTLLPVGTQSKNITFNRFTTLGCDSITHLALTVNPVDEQHLSDSICDGEAYRKYGFDIAATATQGQTSLTDTLFLKNAFGCDSTLYLQLSILPKSFTELTDTIKQGSSYQQHGFDISGTEVGTADFRDTLKNLNGCDSVVVLHLTTLINDDAIADVLEMGIAVYPNPATDRVVLEQRDGMRADSYRLNDLHGRCLMQQSIRGERTEISLQQVASGIYFVSLYQHNQRIAIIKITKE